MQGAILAGEIPAEMTVSPTTNSNGSLIGAALFLGDDDNGNPRYLYYRIIDNGSNIEVFPVDEATAEQFNISTSIISSWYMQHRTQN